METNTASCGGFPGISDSFGAALWALDYGLQMAFHNFSGALLHVGGQNVYYNVSAGSFRNQSYANQMLDYSHLLVCYPLLLLTLTAHKQMLRIAPPTNQSTFHQWTIGLHGQPR